MWENHHTPFHKSETHPALARYEPLLQKSMGNVLVPLCGKSLDMHWFAKRGAKVVGVELSELACRQFFDEAAQSYHLEADPDYQIFQGDRVSLYCGDMFQLALEDDFDFIYDRAALIALPEKLRQPYVDILKRHMARDGHILLITLDYDVPDFDGPPYSVSSEEVARLFGLGYEVTCLHRELNDKVPEAILGRCNESVFLIQPEL